MKSEFLTGQPKNSFVNLSKVHPRGNTEWVQNNIYRCTIFKERHILGTYYSGNNTFVTMTASHLITHLYLAFLGYVYFCKTYNTSWQFIADGNTVFFTFVNTIYLLIFNAIAVSYTHLRAH